MQNCDWSTFSCGGFFIFDPTEEFVLLGECPSGYLSPQKGGVETNIDSSLFDCACRETKEESGILPEDLVYCPRPFIENAPSGRPNIVYWMARLKTMRKHFTFDPAELTSVRWYHIHTFLALQSPKMKVARLNILQAMQTCFSDAATKMVEFAAFPEEAKCIFTAKPSTSSSEDHGLVPKNKYENECRLIVKILRHQLQPLHPDDEGYVQVSDLLTEMKHAQLDKKGKKYKPVTFDILRDIVAYDAKYSKQRLDMKQTANKQHWIIAATQGHSGKTAFKLEEIKEALPHLIHGTEERFLASIEGQGLLKMSRTHVHCIACDPNALQTTQIISGFKKQSNVIVVVNMQQTMQDGMKWFRAKNGVVLTEGPVAPKYLSFRKLT